MKIQAVQAYRGASGYPTLAEIQRMPELLARVPARWEQSSGFAALLGLLALATAPRAEAADNETAPAAAALDPDLAVAPRDNASAVQKTAAVVAPIQYSLLLWAILFGWLVFGDRPQLPMLIGAAVIVIAGLMVVSGRGKPSVAVVDAD